MLKFTKAAEEAPCKQACPGGIDIPRYIRAIRDGNYDDALAIIREKIPLPSICGYVCFHPCETECKTRVMGGPVAINALKRFAAEHGSFQEGPAAKSTGKRVAIIGAGPGGLTAAYYLAKLGHGVTIFEAFPKAGGAVYSGIPTYILPEDVLDREIENILSLGVELKLNTPVANLDVLANENWDAIVIATGCPMGKKLPIPGSDLENVFTGVEFLKDVTMGKPVGLENKRVLVLGGGGVAFDVARTARRLGATDVHIACLESREQIPAPPAEVVAAEEEGIVIHPLQTFAKITDNAGKVTGVECLDLKWMKIDEEGKISFEAIEGSEHVIEADTVFFAVGQAPGLELISSNAEIKIGKQNNIEIDPENCQTGQKGVFAIGDVVSGPTSVIETIAMARTAVAEIDKYFGGNGQIEETLAAPEKEITPITLGLPIFPRVAIPALDVAKRIICFDEVDATFSEDAAREEANRCLRCDLPIAADGANCTVCMVCQMICAYKFTRNSFNVTESAIQLKRTAQGTCEAEFTDKCDNCGLCARYCSYGSLVRGIRE